jgi:hypothetical protein
MEYKGSPDEKYRTYESAKAMVDLPLPTYFITDYFMNIYVLKEWVDRIILLYIEKDIPSSPPKRIRNEFNMFQ